MKKDYVHLRIKCMVLLLFLFCLSQIFTAPCGDVNSNGNIDIIDALMSAQYYVGLNPPNYDPTAADVNGDGRITIVDALITAQYYVGLVSSLPGCNQPTPPKMPIYKVISSGINEDQARALCQALGIDPKKLEQNALVDRNGLLVYTDEAAYQQVPVKQLGSGKEDEKGNKTQLQAVDVESLKNLRVIPGDKALDIFQNALIKSTLLPAEGKVLTGSSELELYEKEKSEVFRVNIDTRVKYSLSIDNVPLSGPGARISVAFAPDGQVTSLQYATRELKVADYVELLTEEEIRDMLRKKHGDKELDIKLSLVYFAPPLSNKAQIIIPHYECRITGKSSGEEVSYLDELVPAVRDTRYAAALTASAVSDGRLINAEVKIDGGTAPYTIQWNVSGVLKTSENTAVISQPVARAMVSEWTIPVTVTDANGIIATTATQVAVSPNQLQIIELPILTPANWREFGTENSVTNQFGDLEQGFVDEMLADGVYKDFQWKGIWAWEQDFKANMDSYYIDETDITLYVGHGNPEYFTFEDTTHNDYKLDYNDADDDWGDKDLEWLALYSCVVMKKDHPGLSVFDRWKQEFDGLHLLLGFHTNAQANMTFTRAFASNMVDSNQSVRSAWFNAITSDQPSDRVGVVMGAGHIDGGGNWIWNSNDHFWGHGSVGQDYSGSEIDFYWTITVW